VGSSGSEMEAGGEGIVTCPTGENKSAIQSRGEPKEEQLVGFQWPWELESGRRQKSIRRANTGVGTDASQGSQSDSMSGSLRELIRTAKGLG
jgi:hypothetical protein